MVPCGLSAHLCISCGFPIGARCASCSTFYRSGRFTSYTFDSETLDWVTKDKTPSHNTACGLHRVLAHKVAYDVMKRAAADDDDDDDVIVIE